VVNTEPGAGKGKDFYDGTMAYICQLRGEGIFPDMFILQSWYTEPAEHLPEDQPYTFMFTAKRAIGLIKMLYPDSSN
jgi:hypothetical protein